VDTVLNVNFNATESQARDRAGGSNASAECDQDPYLSGVAENCVGVGTDFMDPHNPCILLSIDVPPPNNSLAFNCTLGSIYSVVGYNCTLKTDTPKWVSHLNGQGFTDSLAFALMPYLVYGKDDMRQVIQLISNSLLAINVASLDDGRYTVGVSYGCVVAGMRVELPLCEVLAIYIGSLFRWLIRALAANYVTIKGGQKHEVLMNFMGWMDQAIREADGTDMLTEMQITAEQRKS
jgi:hypothetical protein